MRYVITQKYTQEHKDLFDLTNQINKSFAEKNGFEYIENGESLCPDRKIWWEKIAWLNKLLPTLPDDTLVVYEDCDSINIGGDLTKALHDSFEYGMVQLRGGMGGSEIVKWFNCGVIIMKNTPDVRAFLERVWNRNDDTDETSINKELQSLGNTIGKSKSICSLDVEWNTWRNNEHLTTNINIKSWHGMSYSDKITAIKLYINNEH